MKCHKYGEANILTLKYNNKKLNPDVKDFQYSRGINIALLMQPNEKSHVFIKIKEKFRVTDFELFTSYHPATDLRVIIRNKFRSIHFDFEVFYFTNVIPEIKENYSEIFFHEGILPHQGVRLNWTKSKKMKI